MRIASLSAAIPALMLLVGAACSGGGDGIDASEQAEWVECVSLLDRRTSVAERMDAQERPLAR